MVHSRNVATTSAPRHLPLPPKPVIRKTDGSLMWLGRVRTGVSDMEQRAVVPPAPAGFDNIDGRTFFARYRPRMDASPLAATRQAAPRHQLTASDVLLIAAIIVQVEVIDFSADSPEVIDLTG